MSTQDKLESREGMLARMIGEQASNAVLNSRRILPKHSWNVILNEALKPNIGGSGPALHRGRAEARRHTAAFAARPLHSLRRQQV